MIQINIENDPIIEILYYSMVRNGMVRNFWITVWQFSKIPLSKSKFYSEFNADKNSKICLWKFSKIPYHPEMKKSIFRDHFWFSITSIKIFRKFRLFRFLSSNLFLLFRYFTWRRIGQPISDRYFHFLSTLSRNSRNEFELRNQVWYHFDA